MLFESAVWASMRLASSLRSIAGSRGELCGWPALHSTTYAAISRLRPSTASRSSAHSARVRRAMMSLLPAHTKRMSGLPSTSSRKRWRTLRIVEPNRACVSQMTGAPVAAATRSAMRGVRAVAWLEAPDPATRESPTATRRRYSDRVAPSRSRAMPERSPSGSGASRTVLAAQAAWASRIVLFTGFTVADPNTRRAPGVRGPLPRRTVEGGA